MGQSTIKLLITAGLLAAAGLAIIRTGGGLPAITLALAGLAALWWWFIRAPRPEKELPSAAVSCCHYLGDQEEHTRNSNEKDISATRKT